MLKLQFCDLMLNPTQFQAKEEKVKVVDASLSEADPLSEMHLLSEASSLLSGWETLKEDKPEICTPSAQPAHPARMLSFLTLNAPMLANTLADSYQQSTTPKNPIKLQYRLE
ncbi:hypothetical protein HKD37_11G031738 [Glycine soja]